MKYKKLSPEQIYLLFNHVNINQEKLKNLSLVDALKEVRRELKFSISLYSYKRARRYFNLKKDLCTESNTCKISILTKYVANLYKENLLPIPEELRKLLGE